MLGYNEVLLLCVYLWAVHSHSLSVKSHKAEVMREGVFGVGGGGRVEFPSSNFVGRVKICPFMVK